MWSASVEFSCHFLVSFAGAMPGSETSRSTYLDVRMCGAISRDWQDDAEGCSVALIIGGSKTTLMSFDNGARHRKTAAHSFALGRDECVEYAVATDDARTVIDDLEQHGPVVKGACGNENLRCASRDFRGLYPVRDEVKKDLLNLYLVDEHRRQAIRQLESDIGGVPGFVLP